jgi:hypothetical protein
VQIGPLNEFVTESSEGSELQLLTQNSVLAKVRERLDDQLCKFFQFTFNCVQLIVKQQNPYFWINTLVPINSEVVSLEFSLSSFTTPTKGDHKLQGPSSFTVWVDKPLNGTEPGTKS